MEPRIADDARDGSNTPFQGNQGNSRDQRDDQLLRPEINREDEA